MRAPHPPANPRARRAARISTPRRRLLDHAQCVELLDLWLDAYASLETLRARPLGRHLRRLPVPTLLSESIAALHCSEILGQPATASEGINGHDLLVAVKDGVLDVEVKGSTADWITITRTDRSADAVVWLDFTRLLVDRRAPIDAKVLGMDAIARSPDRLIAQRAGTPHRRVQISSPASYSPVMRRQQTAAR